MKVDYPLLPEVQRAWKNIEMFSISGWFANRIGKDICAVAFGGFFKLDPSDHTFSGQTADIFGQGYIEGDFTGETMIFKKVYEIPKFVRPEEDDPIHYILQRKGDSWIGNYRFVNDPAELVLEERKAVCVINPVIENAYGIVAGPIRGSRDMEILLS